MPRTPGSARTSRPATGRGSALLAHVVEGDRAFARGLADALEARGVAVRVILRGRAALDEVAADRPDLIVLCAELPDISGYVVCSRLKRSRKARSVPIILTSARSGARTFESHQQLWVRADAYLRKPFDAAVLLRTAATLVDLPPEPRPSPRVRAPAAPPPEAPGADEILEDGFVYLGGGPEPLDDHLVHVVAPAPVAHAPARARAASPPPPPAGEEVLEEGFVYLGGAEEPEVLDGRLVHVVAPEGRADGERIARGRWKLPAGMGCRVG